MNSYERFASGHRTEGHSIRCPSCRSPHIDSYDHGRRLCAAVGTVSGVTIGVSSAAVGAETGAIVGMVAGPVGAALAGFAGAILGGLVGASLGCATGAKVGNLIDEQVLDNYACLSCGHEFHR